jgi:hypothetical protein
VFAGVAVGTSVGVGSTVGSGVGTAVTAGVGAIVACDVTAIWPDEQAESANAAAQVNTISLIMPFLRVNPNQRNHDHSVASSC